MVENTEMKLEWLHCPRCGGKTRTQIRQRTVLEDFPLFCPKCKYTDGRINIRQWFCENLR